MVGAKTDATAPPVLPGEVARRLVECAPVMILLVDDQGVVRYMGGAGAALTGYSAEDTVGHNVLEFVDAEWSPMALESIGAALVRQGLQRPMLFRLRRKDGTHVVAEVQANSQWDDPVLQAMVVYIRPCDERMLLDRVVESLAAGDDMTDTLELLTMVMGAETLEADGVVLLLNDDRRSARSITAIDLAGGLRVDNARDGTPWGRAMDVGAPVWSPVDELPLDLRALARSAGYRWCWAWPITGDGGCRGCLVLWRRGDEAPDHTCTMVLENLVRITGLVLDRERAASQLLFAATHDPLTGLANRAQFFGRLEQAVQGGDGPLIGVLYVDLDKFKPVNDELGHGAGDRVLRSVGRRIRAVVRERDLVARLGGDEFAVMCPGVDDPEALGHLADRLTSALHDPIALEQTSVVVGASVGIAYTEPGAVETDALIEAADAALYAVKATARGTWRMADPVAPLRRRA